MTCTQVVNGESALLLKLLDRLEVADGEVNHVDVVADSRAVGRRVVVAEDGQLFQAAHRDLRDVRQQVVRYARGVFADHAGLVRADRVEVAQQHHVPFGVGLLHVGQHFFEHGLCLSVGVRAFALGAFFGNRNHGRVAVHGGRRREDDVLAAVVAHGVQEHERGVHVVFVVFERHGDRFANGLEPGKVDAGVKVVFLENLVHGGGIADVSLDEGDGLPDNFGDPAERFLARVHEVVDGDNGMALLVEFDNRVRSNVTGATCQQDVHNKSFLSLSFER